MQPEVKGPVPGLPPIGQIGIVVRDIDKSMELFSTVFGIGPFKVMDLYYPEERGTFRGKPAAFHIKIAFAQMGAVAFELMEHKEGKSIYTEHLEKKGEGMHHIGFYVDDLDAAVGEWTAKGFKVLQSGRSESGSGFAYIDTEEYAGVIFEFIHASYKVVDGQPKL